MHLIYFIATENEDYDPGPYNVTVFAGERRVLINISIINDSVNEGMENFSFAISSANLHPNISIGNTTSTAIVSIVDEIGKLK